MFWTVNYNNGHFNVGRSFRTRQEAERFAAQIDRSTDGVVHNIIEVR